VAMTAAEERKVARGKKGQKGELLCDRKGEGGADIIFLPREGLLFDFSPKKKKTPGLQVLRIPKGRGKKPLKRRKERPAV